MVKSLIRRYCPIAFLFTIACIDPFSISQQGYEATMVVDGYVTTDLKPQQVKISRASKVGEQTFIPEQDATVAITTGKGEKHILSESSPGIYLSSPFAGVIGEKYTLSFTTAEGVAYQSTDVELRDNPGISNVYATYSPTFLNGDGGIEIYVDTEDPSGKTRYYRWEYKETFEIMTPFPSNFVWVGGNDVIFRDQPVGHCWGQDSSKNGIVKNTVGLAEDKITKVSIRMIPGYSYIMRIKYSILIRQYALSQEGYTYWKSLADVNQSQGTLYDHQPGTVRGNLSSVSNPNEIVLGYFDAGKVTERRQFYTPSDFSKDGYQSPKFLTSCQFLIPIEIKQFEIGAYMQQNQGKVLIWEAAGLTPNVVYSIFPNYCCDCTNLGTNKKPSFWP